MTLCDECKLPQPKDPELSLHLRDCSRHSRRSCLIELLGGGLTDERLEYLKKNYFDPPLPGGKPAIERFTYSPRSKGNLFNP